MLFLISTIKSSTRSEQSCSPFVLDWIALDCTALYCIVLCCVVMYCIVLCLFIHSHPSSYDDQKLNCCPWFFTLWPHSFWEEFPLTPAGVWLASNHFLTCPLSPTYACHLCSFSVEIRVIRNTNQLKSLWLKTFQYTPHPCANWQQNGAINGGDVGGERLYQNTSRQKENLLPYTARV